MSSSAAVGGGLDERQREAVEAPPGPLLILAGAGAGKTRVLTERAAALAGRPGLGPEAVLVITFTNRAAAELRSRLVALIGSAASERMTVGTFHAVCHRMLRAHARRVGRSPGFSVYDARASRRLIALALAEIGAEEELAVRLVADQIGRAKARLLGPGDYGRLARSELARRVACAFERYERALERADAVDFDDLIARAVELLAEPELLARYRRRFRALLVDEYQDTNPAQYEWLRRLGQGEVNLSAVGDDDQAVYGFRSADVANMLVHFERDYAATRVVALERNYRSSGAIVAAAARLVAHNRRRRQKTMWTAAPTGPAVVAIACADEREEAEQAAAWCRVLAERGSPLAEISLLFRTRAQARLLEDGLLVAGVPCRLLGGQGLWESAAVRDLVAHLALLANPRDGVALARALRCQPGVGGAAVARVLGAGERRGGDLIATCVEAAAIAGLGGRRLVAVESFGRCLRGLAAALERRGIAGTASDAVVALGLAERLRRDRSLEQLERLRRFCRVARRYEREAEDPSLAEFLAQAALAAGEGEEPHGEAVTLATLHAAKGGEWDQVRIVGLCEGLLPHERALRRGELEEERRLAYVGMTRARRELALSWPRRLRGQPTHMSRFLGEAGLVLAAGGRVQQHGGRRAA